MSRVRVASFAISIDGYAAGPDQSLANPLGVGGTELMGWVFPTRSFQRRVLGAEGGSTGLDDEFAERGFENIGAWILGRNMFGPVRGPWPDESWQGWWGEEPPYHVPVFVLTHYPRGPLAMKGGTTFHFVPEGPEEALSRAKAAAGGRDVRIGGGVATVRQFLAADLIDHLYLVVVPIVLGRGERLWDGLEGIEERFTIEATPSPQGVVHMAMNRRL